MSSERSFRWGWAETPEHARERAPWLQADWLDAERERLEAGPGGDVDANERLTRTGQAYVPGLKRTISMWLRLYERVQCGEMGGVDDGQQDLLVFVDGHDSRANVDPVWALAHLDDLYVNDAFGTAHRAHASTEDMTHSLPSVAGLLMEKKLAYLGRARGRCVYAHPTYPTLWQDMQFPGGALQPVAERGGRDPDQRLGAFSEIAPVQGGDPKLGHDVVHMRP